MPLIQTWTRALSGIRHSTPACGSNLCTAARWQLWARHANGISLNGEWYCSEDCVDVALAQLLMLTSKKTQPNESIHTLPLGLLMLARGVIDEHHLKSALDAQRRNPALKIGQCLCQLGVVSETELTRAIGAQLSLPVLSTDCCADASLPSALMEASRCLAFRGVYQSGLLYVGFDGTVNRSLISATEKILDCKCEPCIVSSSFLDRQLELRCRQKHPNEIVFETRCSESEILRSIHSYVQQVRADQVRVSATDLFFWAKISGTRTLDLLFRL